MPIEAIEQSKASVPTVFESSRPGRRAVALPAPGVPAPAGDDELFPPELLRRAPARLPELTELDVIRHFTRLSHKNFCVDAQFYPLGSCTMKHNGRLGEAAAALPGFTDLHPYQADGDVQGVLELLHGFERMLAAILGLPAVSLQPAGGAHGELAGLLCIRAYHRDRGQGRRDRVLVPESAHGTNPATVTLAGMEVVPVATAPDGGVDLDDFLAKLDDRVAAMMITNPSTLGIFERNVVTIARRLHQAGALLYMDGANMNALVGTVRPGDLGVDVMHINVHKTLSTPHGGGGPGAGPIAVSAALEPYLPVPRIVLDDGRYRLDEDRPRSIGKMVSFHGQTLNFVRAYAYLRAHAREDLAAISRHAVLAANYVLARLKGRYHLPYPGPCMHEVVLSARAQKAAGVRAYDVAKRLLDYGFHPPTMYFPLIVAEALMIEPTETENKDTLDAFCEAMIRIADEVETQPEVVLGAPSTLPVMRVDEVGAARHPILRVKVA